MHVISKKPFEEASKKYPNQRSKIEDLYRALKNSNFSSPDDMRRVFPSLDNFKHKDKWWVIDIAGNNLRMIAFIQFVNKRLFVKHIVSHAEYDKICKEYARGK